jgi:hypothetical protein|tara:strand:+ start:268 stop:474 length:207 start_codon:yes stop_codon:yes gene_type:complete
MAKKATTATPTTGVDSLMEERKIKALEKIANSLDAMTLWFEEIDKDEWGPRIEWYLSMWKEKYIDDEK